jgi:hypothetical protein
MKSNSLLYFVTSTFMLFFAFILYLWKVFPVDHPHTDVDAGGELRRQRVR